jgi:dGTPase
MASLYRDNDWERLADEPPKSEELAYRTNARKDYARLLHSASWRRLQGKTQLFPGVDSEFFRNRLTHSLEVAQIAKSIALRINAMKLPLGDDGAQLEVDVDLVEFAGLAHDLGHPPFGHEGEDALDELMRPFGGFEGNAQTLRILTVLEDKVRVSDPEESLGLDLTMRSLAAVLKYDSEIPLKRASDAKLAKGYYWEESALVAHVKQMVSQQDGVPAGEFKTLECLIMDVADDIAYSTYDFEDAMKAGFRTPLDLIAPDAELMSRVIERTNQNLPSAQPTNTTEASEVLKELVGYSGLYDRVPAGDDPQTAAEQATMAQVYRQAARVISEQNYLRTRFTSRLIGKFVNSVKVDINVANPPLSKAYLERDDRLRVELLKHLNFETIIRSHRLRMVAHRGHEIVRSIFEAIRDNPKLLPDLQLANFEALGDLQKKMRCICDFVACLTDREAVDFYTRLRSETHTTIFKPVG